MRILYQKMKRLDLACRCNKLIGVRSTEKYLKEFTFLSRGWFVDSEGKFTVPSTQTTSKLQSV